MKKSNRLLCSVLAGLMVAGSAASFSACNGGGGAGTNEVVAYDGSAVTITFYHTMGANLRGLIDKYLPDFYAMYPNITVEHQYIGDYPVLRDQIATELTGGNSPNLSYCYPDHVALYNKAGAVLPIDDYISSTQTVTKADGTTETMGFTADQISNFVEAYYNEGKAYGDGKMYTLPYAKSTELLYYNKTYFDANNLTVPTTWDEMEAVCKQIKEKEGANVTPLGYDSEANWFITMTEQLGTPYTSADPNTGYFLFNTAENRAFVERFRGWYEKGYMTTSTLYGNGQSYTSDLFTETAPDALKCYLCIGSSGGATYQCPDLETVEVKDAQGNPVLDQEGNPVTEEKYPFEVGVAPIPQINKNNPKIIQQGPSICIFRKQNPQEQAASWLFTKFLTTYDLLQAEVSMMNGYTPAIKSAQQNPVYVDFLAQADGNAFLKATAVKATLSQLNDFYISPAFNGSSAARDEVGALLQACFTKSTAGYNSVADMIKAEFDKSINTLKYDYGFAG